MTSNGLIAQWLGIFWMMPVMPITCQQWVRGRACLTPPCTQSRSSPLNSSLKAAQRWAKQVVRAQENQDSQVPTQVLREAVQDQETFSTAAGVVEPVEEHVAEVPPPPPPPHPPSPNGNFSKEQCYSESADKCERPMQSRRCEASSSKFQQRASSCSRGWSIR